MDSVSSAQLERSILLTDSAAGSRRSGAWCRKTWVGVTLILLGTFAAYLPAMRAGFIWDDDDYVTQNENPSQRRRPGADLVRAAFDPAVLPAGAHELLDRARDLGDENRSVITWTTCCSTHAPRCCSGGW
jgi:hypothetical protein